MHCKILNFHATGICDEVGNGYRVFPYGAPGPGALLFGGHCTEKPKFGGSGGTVDVNSLRSEF